MPTLTSPMITCVYFFEDELKYLLECLEEAPDSIYYLYGLWTHSSNVVVHLVSKNEDPNLSTAHRLDCVGYVAKENTSDTFCKVSRHIKSRQHIFVDADATKKTKSLRAFAMHQTDFRNRRNNSRQETLFVKYLRNRSPFGIQQRGKKSSNRQNKSENVQHEVNQENGNDDAKIRGRFIRILANKIAFELSDEKKDPQIPSQGSLQFYHNNKQWQVNIQTDQANCTGTSVEILYKEDYSSDWVKKCSEKFELSKLVVDKIKELCPCEKCTPH